MGACDCGVALAVVFHNKFTKHTLDSAPSVAHLSSLFTPLYPLVFHACSTSCTKNHMPSTAFTRAATSYAAVWLLASSFMHTTPFTPRNWMSVFHASCTKNHICQARCKWARAQSSFDSRFSIVRLSRFAPDGGRGTQAESMLMECVCTTRRPPIGTYRSLPF